MIIVRNYSLRFANHQRSKKHKENAALLRKLLQEEDASMEAHKSHDSSDQSDHSVDDKIDQTQKSHDSTDHCVEEEASVQHQSSSTATDNPRIEENLPTSNTTQDIHHEDFSPVGSDSEDVLLSLLRYCMFNAVLCI